MNAMAAGASDAKSGNDREDRNGDEKQCAQSTLVRDWQAPDCRE
jgi:hypothetical protein